VSFFHGCVIALKIEATAVFAAWFAVRFWQVLTCSRRRRHDSPGRPRTTLARRRLRIAVDTTRTQIFRRPLGLPAKVARRKIGQVRGLPRKS
jgi:hypothetical protein